MSDATRNNGTSTEGRNPDGTFAAGNRGRPQGARHKTTMAILSLMEGQGEALAQKAIDLALEGDTTALRLCVERIAPVRKDGPVSFELPSMQTPQDAAKGAASILDAVSAGELTPCEGAQVMGLVEQFRRALELSELEVRVSKLEATR